MLEFQYYLDFLYMKALHRSFSDDIDSLNLLLDDLAKA